MKLFVSFLFSCLMISNFAYGQDKPSPSPSSTIMQKVGLTDVTVEYSRPSMKDRKIFASDGLVPFGKIWRTGANAATKVTFSDDVTVGGKELAAGSYAILTKPGASEWAIHFYPYDQTRFNTYTEKEPTVAIMAEPVNMDITVETFLISFDMLRDNSAVMGFGWENTWVPFEIGVK